MKLSERAEEILETLWISIIEENKKTRSVGLSEREEAVTELLMGGFIELSEEEVSLKERGRKQGERIIRRHRLAERLLVDVLDMKKVAVHEVGCKFEHLILDEVEENVCTLLGHPKFCPHGKTIPPGLCCKKAVKEVARAVCPLKDMEPDYQGTIAYLATNDKGRLHKLIAMGILPGLKIRMIQKFPSFVFQIGQSQFAIDQQMAEGIYVRLKRGSKKE